MSFKTAPSAAARKHGEAHPPAPRRAEISGGTGIHGSLLHRQHTRGNQYVQRLMSVARQEASPAFSIASDIDRARGGQPLDRSARQQMESAFGFDFSGVRTHTDAESSSLNDALEAKAFTTGQHIFFRSGAYDPASSAGRRLLAHELTHVVQQSGPSPASARVPVQRRCAACEEEAAPEANLMVSEPQDADEVEADAVAERVTSMLDGASSGAPLGSTGRDQPTTISRYGDPLVQREATEDPEIDDESRPLQSITIARSPLMIQRSASISGWTFRNSGKTASDNCCGLCPEKLGVGAPGSFKNGMELKADISGHESGVSYDIKRIKERSTWLRSGGTWSNLNHVGPGAADDAHNADECLVPSSRPEHIYSIDTPGFQSSIAAPGAGDTDRVYKSTFSEFVEITEGAGGRTDPRTFEWHSIAWLKNDGGSWKVDAPRSEIGSGTVTVGTTAP